MQARSARTTRTKAPVPDAVFTNPFGRPAPPKPVFGRDPYPATSSDQSAFGFGGPGFGGGGFGNREDDYQSFGGPPRPPGPFGFGAAPPMEVEGMGRRMVTVEVTGMQSTVLRSGRLVVTGPDDLEVEAAAIYEEVASSSHDGTMIHTTVSGRLLDTSSGAVVVDVYPFIVRTAVDVAAGATDWVCAVRDGLGCGVHPAPCGLYSRRVSKGGESLFGGCDVVCTAKALLGDGGGAAGGALPVVPVRWDIAVSATIMKAVKVRKEVLAPTTAEEDSLPHGETLEALRVKLAGLVGDKSFGVSMTRHQLLMTIHTMMGGGDEASSGGQEFGFARQQQSFGAPSISGAPPPPPPAGGGLFGAGGDPSPSGKIAIARLRQQQQGASLGGGAIGAGVGGSGFGLAQLRQQQ